MSSLPRVTHASELGQHQKEPHAGLPAGHENEVVWERAHPPAAFAVLALRSWGLESTMKAALMPAAVTPRSRIVALASIMIVYSGL